MSRTYLGANCTLNGQTIRVTLYEVSTDSVWKQTVTLPDGESEQLLDDLPGYDAHEFYAVVEMDVVDAYPVLHDLHAITTDEDGGKSEVGLGGGVTFTCSNGGTVQMIGEVLDLEQTGVTNGGFAFWDDLYINASNDVTLNVGRSYNTKATVQHVTGDPVLHFDLTSREPNGKADIRVRGLKPSAWYRLQFDGALAKTAGGRAHGQTDEYGTLVFKGVHLPNS